jgi:hypothetical protein
MQVKQGPATHAESARCSRTVSRALSASTERIQRCLLSREVAERSPWVPASFHPRKETDCTSTSPSRTTVCCSGRKTPRGPVSPARSWTAEATSSQRRVSDPTGWMATPEDPTASPTFVRTSSTAV